MKLIGLTGPAGCGKDTVARFMVQHCLGMQVAFGDAIRDAATAMFDLTYEQLCERELKEVVIPEWDMSPRQMMQMVGTECGRNVFGDDIWIKRLRLRVHRLPPTEYVVVSDVRTEAQAEWVRSCGGRVVHITRDSVVAVRAHSTEAGVAFAEGDFALDNCGNNLAELERCVRDNVRFWVDQCDWYVR